MKENARNIFQEKEDRVWLTDSELQNVGLAHLGRNVLIDSQVLIFNPQNISIGDFTRIDAFSLLSAGEEKIEIGKYVHISHSTRIYGSEGIEISDFAGISSGVAIFTVSDDYSSDGLNNPTVPTTLRKLKSGRIEIGRASIIGANSVILPGVSIGSAASIGALSLVNKGVPDGWIVSGNPLRKVGFRDSDRIHTYMDQITENNLEEK